MSIISNLVKAVWDKKVIRFASIGVINTLIDITILNSLVYFFALTPLLANLISASISISLSYFLNHHLVFRSDKSHSIKSFAHFFLVTGLGILVLQSIVIFLLIQLLGTRGVGVNYALKSVGITQISTKVINLNIAKICAVLVTMIWNFAFYHFVIFKKDESISSV